MQVAHQLFRRSRPHGCKSAVEISVPAAFARCANRRRCAEDGSRRRAAARAADQARREPLPPPAFQSLRNAARQVPLSPKDGTHFERRVFRLPDFRKLHRGELIAIACLEGSLTHQRHCALAGTTIMRASRRADNAMHNSETRSRGVEHSSRQYSRIRVALRGGVLRHRSAFSRSQ